MPKYVVTLINPEQKIYVEAENYKQADDKMLQTYYHRYGEIELFDETNPNHQIPEKLEYIHAVYCKYYDKPIRYMLPLNYESFESIKQRIAKIYGKHLDKVEQIDKKNACVYITEDGMRGLRSLEEIGHNYRSFLTLQEAGILWEAAMCKEYNGSKIDIMLLLKALYYYKKFQQLLPE